MDTLLHGYLDGELDLVHTLSVEEHLRGCAACADACEQLRRLQSALRAEVPRFGPPPGLARRVQVALRAADRAEAPARRRPWRWLATAAALLMLALGGWGLLRTQVPSRHDLLAREVVASHIRSLMAEHLTDVRSGDRHTVRPWLSRKLDFAPAVPDLDEQSFPLVGGRLDYVAGRPVAALVYRRRQHVINLLTWPEDAEAPLRTEMRQGYHLCRWARAGMRSWAVSDLNAEELAEFARLLGAQER
jgi:anti-sigma factor RsiW